MFVTGMKVACRAFAPINRNFVRHASSPVCTPPRCRVSFAEKVIHGVVMGGAVVAIPTYIAVNFKNYRQDSE